MGHNAFTPKQLSVIEEGVTKLLLHEKNQYQLGVIEINIHLIDAQFHFSNYDLVITMFNF